MAEITVAKLINASRTKVWDVASDIGHVDVFHPMVEAAIATSDLKRGVGASRRCDFYDGKGSVDETVTAWTEGQSFTIAITRGTMPFKQADATFTFQDAGPARTMVEVTMRYKMKGGPLGAMFGVLMVGPMMKKMLRGVLEGLDTHCRTGNRIGRNGAITQA
ncbi:MAG: SRPBCC family protein [Rhodospirillales bacterium]|nr:MAG: SRPBCC family protein [Rhodospirillales bacterium]